MPLKHQYGIRKLKTGVGSILLSTVILSVVASNQSVSAQESVQEDVVSPLAESVEEVMEASEKVEESVVSNQLEESLVLEESEVVDPVEEAIEDPLKLDEDKNLVEEHEVKQETLAVSEAQTSEVSVSLESGKSNEESLVGLEVTDRVKLTVTGTNKNYENTYLEYKLTLEEGQKKNTDKLTVTSTSGTSGRFDSATGIYRVDVGNLHSGSNVVLPFKLKSEGGRQDVKYRVDAKLKNGDGTLLGEVSKLVDFQTLKVVNPRLELYRNDEKDDNGVQYLGSHYKDGEVRSRSTRVYTFKADVQDYDKWKQYLTETDSLIGVGTDLGLVVEKDASNDGFRAKEVPAVTYYLSENGNTTKFKAGTVALKRLAEGKLRVAYVFQGSITEMPDTVLTPKILNGSEVVEMGSVLTHKNKWRALEQGLSIGMEDIAVTDTSIRVGEYQMTGIPVSNRSVSPWSVQTAREGVNDVSVYSLGNSGTFERYAVETRTKLRAQNKDRISYVNKWEIDIPKQVDGDNPLGEEHTIRVRLDDKQSPNLENGVVYAVRADGSKHRIGTLGEMAKRNFSEFYSANKILVEWDGVKYQEVSGDGVRVDITSFLPNATALDSIRTRHVKDDMNRNVTSADGNAFHYTTNTLIDDITFTGYSDFGAFGSQELGIDPDLSIRDKNVILGNSTTVSFTNPTNPRTVGTSVDKYQYIAIPKGVEVNFSQGSIVREDVVKDGVEYTLYKFNRTNFGDLFSSAFGMTPRVESILGKPIENGKVKLTIHSGVVISKDRATQLGYNPKMGSGSDTLDLNGDGTDSIEKSLSTDKDVVIGTSREIEVIVPESLYIYDRSNRQGTAPLADTKEVLAGDTVTITPTIRNTTSTEYQNMTLITTLSNPQDEVFDGSSSRGSKFNLTLTGPVTAPQGWDVFYTLEDQVAGQSAKDLGGWESSVADYSKVKALKFVSKSGVSLGQNQEVKFAYQAKTDESAPYGSTVTTTSALAVNGESNFLEGYRSTVEIVKSGTVKVSYRTEDGSAITFEKEGVTIQGTTSPFEYPVGTQYNVSDKGYTSITSTDGKNYVLIEDRKPANETGMIREGNQEVVYTYRLAEQPKGTIRFYYREEGSDTPIVFEVDSFELFSGHYTLTAPEGRLIAVDDKEVGSEYNNHKYYLTEIRDVNKGDWELVEVLTEKDLPRSGELPEGDRTVTLTYRKKFTDVVSREDDAYRHLFVEVVDENGKDIPHKDFEGKQYTSRFSALYVPTRKRVITTKMWGENIISTSEDVEIYGTPYDVFDYAPERIVADDGNTYEFLRHEGEPYRGDLDGHMGVDGLVTYVYRLVPKSVGKYIPVVPGHEVPTVPYDTTPDNPDDDPVLPYIEGFKPSIPLDPKDPNDKTKGYIPPTPVDPAVDTEIPYVEIKKGTVTIAFVDEEGNPIGDEQEVVPSTEVDTSYTTKGKNPPTIEHNGREYTFSRVEGNESGVVVEGNTKVVYVYREKPVDPITNPTTSFVDEDGKVLIPNEDGLVPPREIDGYVFVSTKPDGENQIHVYKPKPVDPVTNPTTSFVDEDGKVLIPNEDGLVPPKEIDGYVFVSTKPDGENQIHVYKPKPVDPVTNPTTSFVDEDGKVLIPNEDGLVPPKEIDGYVFVSTKPDGENQIHVYKPKPKEEPQKPELPKPQDPQQVTKAPKTEVKAPQSATLPQTGESLGWFIPQVLSVLAGLGLVSNRKKKENE